MRYKIPRLFSLSRNFLFRELCTNHVWFLKKVKSFKFNSIYFRINRIELIQKYRHICKIGGPENDQIPTMRSDLQFTDLLPTAMMMFRLCVKYSIHLVVAQQYSDGTVGGSAFFPRAAETFSVGLARGRH